MNKTQLISGIHTLVSNNVIGAPQLFSRYKGFKGELLFENFFSKQHPNYKMLDGGIIFSIDSNESSLNNSIYLTVTKKVNYIDDYLIVYKNLSKVGFERMFIVLYDDDKWNEEPVMIFPNETIHLSIPNLIIKEFDKEKNEFIITNNSIEKLTDFFLTKTPRVSNSKTIEKEYSDWLHENLNEFDRELLLKIYMDRLFLDGFIGLSKERGKISDIDMILKRPDNKLVLVEVKEKDLPKGGKIGFGLDVPRLKDFIKIQESSLIKYVLIVRHVNNQTERKLIGWKYIPITTFRNDVVNQNTIAGSNGMRSIGTHNPTVICSLDLFKNL